jgi:Raf kinase inhibitor-like YbhB/YbcL family protein
MSLEPIGFQPGDPIPSEYTCEGSNTSPSLAWSSPPDAATELVLIVTDPDADDFVHWVIAGLDPSSTGISAGEVPEGAVEASNDGGTVGWTGPCPPAGETHEYLFALHALGEPLGLEAGSTGRLTVTLVEAASLSSATFTAVYTRPA